MASHDSNKRADVEAGTKKKFLNNWVESLHRYQRPASYTLEETTRTLENHDKSSAKSMREGPMPNFISSNNVEYQRSKNSLLVTVTDNPKSQKSHKNETTSNGKSNPIVVTNNSKSLQPQQSNGGTNSNKKHSKKNKSGSSHNSVEKHMSNKTVIDLSKDNAAEYAAANEQYATSSFRDKKGITYYSISMGSNGDQRGSNFLPLKLEPFEMPPTYTTASNDGSGSSKKLVITIADTKSALRKAARKARRKARKEQQKENMQDDAPKDFESITIEDGSNESGMMKRAIERSKHDIGILKRRDALRSDNEIENNNNQSKEVMNKGTTKVVNNDDINQNTLMPKRVLDLLASDSDVTEDEEDERRQIRLAELARAALDSAQKQRQRQQEQKQKQQKEQAPIFIDNEIEMSTNSNESSNKSIKRKRIEETTPMQMGTQEIDEFSNVHSSRIGKVPKLTDDSRVKSLNNYQCLFVEGLKGRCDQTVKNKLYCEKHQKFVSDIEAAFSTDDRDVNHANTHSIIDISHKDNRSVIKRKFPKKSHGLSTVHRDTLLVSLENMKKLHDQEDSLNEKCKLILSQIKSLNRLFRDCEKQRSALFEEQHRVVGILQTLVTEWTPLFVDVSDSSELIGFDSVVKNQRTINKVLSRLKKSTVDPED